MARVRVRDEGRADPPVRGEGLLSALELPFSWADRAIERFVPSSWNPLAQTGAIANLTFIVACATGGLLLVWYAASVHQAYASLEAMKGSVLASLVRSLHRYSSDGCMLFVVLHALRLFSAGRFSGARWLAWITGVILVASLWLVGWLGYWLVWDEAARQIARGTAKMLDVLPIFAEPMARNFLTDGSVQSLLFFIVFFVHMLLPLGMGIALWLHISRLSRPAFLTKLPMTAAVLASLVIVALARPAVSGPPAHMLVEPRHVPVDAFYLLPIAITDRLSGGALWALTLLGGLFAGAVPWVLSRGRAGAAKVELAKCDGCTLCAADCPYDAIQMVPRSDGRKFPVEARVDEDKCVGCGICAGSCDSSAIAIPRVSQVDARRRMDRWIDEALRGEEAPHLAFVCARSAGGSLAFDAETGKSDALPGYRVMPVVCSGWVHALTIERALRHGAKGVLVVSCSEASAHFREGPKWTAQRIARERKPMLRDDKIDPSRVRHVSLDRTASGRLAEIARAFRAGEGGGVRVLRGKLAAATLIASALVLPIATASRAYYAGPPERGPELVVSFRHPGKSGERCREVTAEEKAKMPPHMRRDTICERGRAPVRLRVTIDGVVRIDSSHAPGGLRSDGTSVALESVKIVPGVHDVEVAIGESHDANEWTYRDTRHVRIDATAVVLFARETGFTWEGAAAP